MGIHAGFSNQAGISPMQAAAQHHEATPAKDPSTGFPVMGIGASAGGLAALEAFFSGMPPGAEPGMAFVLVQHLAPDHSSVLADLLKQTIPMEVHEIRDGMQIRPNHVYVIPSGHDLALLGGTLHLLQPTMPPSQRMPIDFFFRSLARDQHEQAIGIVLSGTGSDGAQGVRDIKGEGGMVMVQDPTSAEFSGMPRAVIQTGLTDYVLPPDAMFPRLIAYASQALGKPHQSASGPSQQDSSLLQKILVLVRDESGHDFSQYHLAITYRRVLRRMAVHQIEFMDGYLKYLRRTPEEIRTLLRDLRIGVTSFFRDPDAFKALEQQVIPKLFAGKISGSNIRVWSVGCSTGEEAYSLAMLLSERRQNLQKNFKIQIFATDLDSEAIATARAGLYPVSIASDIGSKRLARFFTMDRETGAYRINQDIRDMVVFSEHDMIRDYPLSRLDLICCRYVLIYMNEDLQNKLIANLHYALVPNGFLFLCPTGTVKDIDDLFLTLDAKMKLYQHKQKHIAAHPSSPTVDSSGLIPSHEEKKWTAGLPLRELTEQALLQEVGLAAALVNGSGDILYLHGRTCLYLESPSGVSGVNNILNMARPGLRNDLRTALHRADAGGKTVHCPGLRVKSDGDVQPVNLTVRPVSTDFISGIKTDLSKKNGASLYLIILEPGRFFEQQPSLSRSDLEGVNAFETSTGYDQDNESEIWIAALQQQLLDKEEQLRVALIELRKANAELKSSNEEMYSVNQELSFSNEKLSSSKKELESVNVALQAKIAELSRANNDMNNLFAGTGVGTLFVDMDLRIVRFTPDITSVINLIEADIGRPVGHILSNLENYDDLVADTRIVINTLTAMDVEVLCTNGLWYLMHIRPYRTMENRVEGAVISFVNITHRKKIEEEKQKSEEHFKQMFLNAPMPYQSLDEEANFLDVNQAFMNMLGYSTEELIGESVERFLPPELVEGFRAEFAKLKITGEIHNVEFKMVRKDGAVILVSLSSKVQRDNEGRFVRTHCILQDITEKNRADRELKEALDQLSATLNALPDIMFEIDIEGRIIDYRTSNPELLFAPPEQFLFKTVHEVLPEEVVIIIDEAIAEAAADGTNKGAEYCLRTGDKSRWFELSIAVKGDPLAAMPRFIVLVRDITDRKHAEQELQAARDQLTATLNTLPDLLIEVDDNGLIHDYRAPVQELLYRPRTDFLSESMHDVLPINMSRVIEEALTEVKFEGLRKGIVFSLYLGEDLHFFEMSVAVKGDPHVANPHFIILARDITERRQAEEALQKSQMEFQTLAEKCPISIMRFDKYGQVTFVNEWHIRTFGQDKMDKSFFLGKYIHELPGLVKAGIGDAVRDLVQGQPLDMDEVFFPEFTGGHSGWVSVRGVPILQDDIPTGGILIREDVTERRRFEEEIIEYNAQLQKALAERDKFFSIIAHDLRSPFIGFLVFIKMLTERIENLCLEDIQRLSQDMQQSAENLYNLLENLLEWAIIQRGEARFMPQHHNLAKLVKHNIDLMHAPAYQKNVQLKYDIPKNLRVYVDQPMFNMILRNLLSNAVKFTKSGEMVLVTATKRDSMVVISVEDNGMGMDQTALSKLFMLDKVSSRKGTAGEKGTGLGLLLCKEFVQMHGGKIWAQSKHNEGSTFYFTLPAHKPDEAPDQQALPN
ncbi:chemotaxis protein CheB [Desulfonatronum thiosulfatophilum]|nr:chemotaxis protein CheB [Desulfonatronum thiosulfatophilum]